MSTSCSYCHVRLLPEECSNMANAKVHGADLSRMNMAGGFLWFPTGIPKTWVL